MINIFPLSLSFPPQPLSLSLKNQYRSENRDLNMYEKGPLKYLEFHLEVSWMFSICICRASLVAQVVKNLTANVLVRVLQRRTSRVCVCVCVCVCLERDWLTLRTWLSGRPETQGRNLLTEFPTPMGRSGSFLFLTEAFNWLKKDLAHYRGHLFHTKLTI